MRIRHLTTTCALRLEAGVQSADPLSPTVYASTLSSAHTGEFRLTKVVEPQRVLARTVSAAAHPACGVAARVNLKQALAARVGVALEDAGGDRCAADAQDQHAPQHPPLLCSDRAPPRDTHSWTVIEWTVDLSAASEDSMISVFIATQKDSEA